ncbi:hypothetical protein P4O66_017065 [Electrophorus voltai]|uniref:Cadherin-22 n=1 Tax=Electrophorus voltai TaxID=2609070 RepID=A0AAD8YWX3_9TELE|nr:hypothetical protein P4O66_017065 [Electrophorus voltai]
MADRRLFLLVTLCLWEGLVGGGPAAKIVRRRGLGSARSHPGNGVTGQWDTSLEKNGMPTFRLKELTGMDKETTHDTFTGYAKTAQDDGGAPVSEQEEAYSFNAKSPPQRKDEESRVQGLAVDGPRELTEPRRNGSRNAEAMSKRGRANNGLPAHRKIEPSAHLNRTRLRSIPRSRGRVGSGALNNAMAPKRTLLESPRKFNLSGSYGVLKLISKDSLVRIVNSQLQNGLNFQHKTSHSRKRDLIDMDRSQLEEPEMKTQDRPLIADVSGSDHHNNSLTVEPHSSTIANLSVNPDQIVYTLWKPISEITQNSREEDTKTESRGATASWWSKHYPTHTAQSDLTAKTEASPFRNTSVIVHEGKLQALSEMGSFPQLSYSLDTQTQRTANANEGPAPNPHTAGQELGATQDPGSGTSDAASSGHVLKLRPNPSWSGGAAEQDGGETGPGPGGRGLVFQEIEAEKQKGWSRKEGQGSRSRSRRSWIWNQFFVIEEYAGPEPVLIGRILHHLEREGHTSAGRVKVNRQPALQGLQRGWPVRGPEAVATSRFYPQCSWTVWLMLITCQEQRAGARGPAKPGSGTEGPRARTHPRRAPGQAVGQLHTDMDRGDGRTKYVLRGEGAGSVFVIDEKTGNIHVTKPLDREEKDEYRLIATATDGQTDRALEPSSQFIIRVQDINDNPPVFEDGPYSATVPEMANIGTSVVQVTATDADDPTYGNSARLVYTLVQGQPHFSVDPQTGILRTAVPDLDRETQEQYLVVLQAKDMGGHLGGLSGTTTVTVRLTDVNDNPPRFAQSTWSFSISELTVPGAEVGRISATDADLGENAKLEYTILEGESGDTFNITGANQEAIIILNKAVDYESRSSYSFSVEVLNPAVDPRFLRRGPFKDRAGVRVAVLDADEPPRFSRARYRMDVSENCPPACTVGRVSAVDPDTGLSGNIRYSIDPQSDPEALFRITPDAGLITTATELDREDEQWHNVTIIATQRGTWDVQLTVHLVVLPERELVSSSEVEKELVSSSEVEKELVSSSEVEKELVSSSEVEKELVSSSEVEKELVSSSEVEKELVFSSEVEKELVSSSEVEKELVSSSEVEKELVSSSEVEKELVSSSEVEKVLVSSSEVQKELVSSSEVEKELMSSSEVDKVLISTSDVEKELVSSSEMAKELVSSSEVEKELVSSSEVEKELVSSSEVEKELVSSSEVEKGLVSSNNPTQVSRVVVAIETLDLNDNAPELDRQYSTAMCDSASIGQIVQVLRAIDRDEGGNDSTVHFNIPPESSAARNFSIRESGGPTASLVLVSPLQALSRSSFSSLTLHVPLVLRDGSSGLTSTGTVTVSVCPCLRGGARAGEKGKQGEAEWDKETVCLPQHSSLPSPGLSTAALLAILACVATLLAVSALSLSLRRQKRDSLSPLEEDDVRENIITYDDEGGGEADTAAFDITALQSAPHSARRGYRTLDSRNMYANMRHRPLLLSQTAPDVLPMSSRRYSQRGQDKTRTYSSWAQAGATEGGQYPGQGPAVYGRPCYASHTLPVLRRTPGPCEPGLAELGYRFDGDQPDHSLVIQNQGAMAGPLEPGVLYAGSGDAGNSSREGLASQDGAAVSEGGTLRKNDTNGDSGSETQQSQDVDWRCTLTLLCPDPPVPACLLQVQSECAPREQNLVLTHSGSLAGSGVSGSWACDSAALPTPGRRSSRAGLSPKKNTGAAPEASDAGHAATQSVCRSYAGILQGEQQRDYTGSLGRGGSEIGSGFMVARPEGAYQEGAGFMADWQGRLGVGSYVLGRRDMTPQLLPYPGQDQGAFGGLLGYGGAWPTALEAPGGGHSLALRVGEFLRLRLAQVTFDPTQPPYDSVQVYGLEGTGSRAGSLSSLESEGEKEADREEWGGAVEDWGPQFHKLARLFRERGREREREDERGRERERERERERKPSGQEEGEREEQSGDESRAKN